MKEPKGLSRRPSGIWKKPTETWRKPPRTLDAKSIKSAKECKRFKTVQKSINLQKLQNENKFKNFYKIRKENSEVQCAKSANINNSAKSANSVHNDICCFNMGYTTVDRFKFKWT